MMAEMGGTEPGGNVVPFPDGAGDDDQGGPGSPAGRRGLPGQAGPGSAVVPFPDPGVRHPGQDQPDGSGPGYPGGNAAAGMMMPDMPAGMPGNAPAMPFSSSPGAPSGTTPYSEPMQRGNRGGGGPVMPQVGFGGNSGVPSLQGMPNASPAGGAGFPVPALQQPPPRPQNPIQPLMQDGTIQRYIQTLQVMGSISPGVGRRNATRALQLITQMLKGYTAQYKSAVTEWEKQNREIIKVNAEATKEYDAILANPKMSLAEKQQEISLRATLRHDELAMQTVSDPRILDQLNRERQEKFGQLAQLRDQISHRAGAAGGDEGGDNLAFQARMYMRTGDPEFLRGVGERNSSRFFGAIREAGQRDGLTEDQIADRLVQARRGFEREKASGRRDVGAGGEVTPEQRRAALLWLDEGRPPQSRQTAFMQGVYRALDQIKEERGLTDQQLDDQIRTRTQDYPVQQRGLTAFTTGRQGDIVRSMSVAVDHLDTLGELGRAWGSGNTQAFNRLAAFLATQTGQAAPTNLREAAGIVGAEIQKALGASTQTERLAAQDAFSAVQSPEQLAGAIETAQRLLSGQLGGLRQQYRRATGRDDFDDLMSPRALDVLSRVRSRSGSSEPSSAPPRDAVEYLRAHPELRPQFDAKYGAGAADKVLGGAGGGR